MVGNAPQGTTCLFLCVSTGHNGKGQEQARPQRRSSTPGAVGLSPRPEARAFSVLKKGCSDRGGTGRKYDGPHRKLREHGSLDKWASGWKDTSGSCTLCLSVCLLNALRPGSLASTWTEAVSSMLTLNCLLSFLSPVTAQLDCPAPRPQTAFVPTSSSLTFTETVSPRPPDTVTGSTLHSATLRFPFSKGKRTVCFMYPDKHGL